jgi:flavin-dependent dehydrogenase
VNALHGAKLLAEAINNADGFDMDALWKYQVNYYRSAGKNVWRLYVLRRWLLEAPDELVERLFATRMIGPEDAERVLTGRFVSLKPLNVLRRSLQLALHPRLAFSVLRMFSHAVWAQECARSIPEKYDERRIAAWRQRLVRAME